MSEIAVGQVIELSDGRKGFVRFVGTTQFAAGEWVGVELEDDSGKNNGSVQGQQYFDCDMGRGMFVRPTTVTILEAVPPPRPTGAGVRKASRPSNLATGLGRLSSVNDPSLGKRMSLNAPSPSPVPRTSRPSSIARVCLLTAGRSTVTDFQTSRLQSLPRSNWPLQQLLVPRTREPEHLQRQVARRLSGASHDLLLVQPERPWARQQLQHLELRDNLRIPPRTLGRLALQQELQAGERH